MTRRVLALVGLLTLSWSPAQAQPAWPGRVRIGLNVGSQLEAQALAESLTVEKHVESAPIAVGTPQESFPIYEAAFAVRLARDVGFGFGVAVSYLSKSTAAQIAADIPHPFYFEQPRAITGTAGLRRTELATHFNAVFVQAWPRLELMVSGGPSIFSVDHDLVSDVFFSEEYPFDTAQFTSATVFKGQESRIGYNVAADVTWRLGRSWGVGALVRFSRARVPFETPDGVEVAKLDAGGLQAGGGLRLMF